MPLKSTHRNVAVLKGTEMQISIKLNTSALDLIVGALTSHEDRQRCVMAAASKSLPEMNFTDADFGIAQTIGLRKQLVRYYERATVAS